MRIDDFKKGCEGLTAEFITIFASYHLILSSVFNCFALQQNLLLLLWAFSGLNILLNHHTSIMSI